MTVLKARPTKCLLSAQSQRSAVLRDVPGACALGQPVSLDRQAGAEATAPGDYDAVQARASLLGVAADLLRGEGGSPRARTGPVLGASALQARADHHLQPGGSRCPHSCSCSSLTRSGPKDGGERDQASVGQGAEPQVRAHTGGIPLIGVR